VCNPNGTVSGNANVSTWLASVAGTLPGAVATSQQIVIGANNVVTVSVCWRRGAAPPHNLVVTAQIQG